MFAAIVNTASVLRLRCIEAIKMPQLWELMPLETSPKRYIYNFLNVLPRVNVLKFEFVNENSSQLLRRRQRAGLILVNEECSRPAVFQNDIELLASSVEFQK